ncbi:EKC/KEOPS complex subunit TP53RK [Drosophila grimshawi]|uniref:non-specific serine/threonine protein kinase n=1 Tax=Drosophila grimshawi TaxID=7222 RepID=B4IX00_DROGR|nr:EKC/KEOPS complex subunit TP53RK [Drosophila grimshawi]EDV96306.1 GH15277 [Drosophila grimshawi]
MALEIIKQGAEGRLYLGEYKGESCLIKERFVKKYRHPELDTQITRQRMKAEVKAAGRCLAAGILAPKILHSDLNTHKLYMEYFGSAQTAKHFIQQTVAKSGEEQAKQPLEELCRRIGGIIGQMHANNVIHGDLTTSNILINPTPNSSDGYDIIFIDFGLSHYNQATEDKGVDLYVLERALLSTHSEQPYLFEHILAAYRKTCGKDEAAVLAKFEEVRARGRKRTMIG